jgi:hypothetical protein
MACGYSRILTQDFASLVGVQADNAKISQMQLGQLQPAVTWEQPAYAMANAYFPVSDNLQATKDYLDALKELNEEFPGLRSY